jgi:TonB family protein
MIQLRGQLFHRGNFGAHEWLPRIPDTSEKRYYPLGPGISRGRSGKAAVRIIAFLLLFTSAASAQTSPEPQSTVTGPSLDWLAPAIAATPQCGSPSPSDASLTPPPRELSILFQVLNPETRNIGLASSSGNSSFDQRAVTCFRGLALPSTANLRGPDTFIIWVHLNNGAVSLDPGRSPQWVPTPLGSRQCSGYPANEALLGRTGETTVGFKITREGTVSDVQVLQSSGRSDFDDAAVACAKQWRYAPPIRDGAPIEISWKAVVKWEGRIDPTIYTIFYTGIHCARHQINPKDLESVSGPTVLQMNVKYGRIPDVEVKISSGSEILDKHANDCFSDAASLWMVTDKFTTNLESVQFNVSWR